MSWSFVPVFLTGLFASCTSAPPANLAPDWTRQTARSVDNGYIVYVGKVEASRADDAQFKSEGLALEDLANECSMIPKGTRIEDRYLETTKTGYAADTKVALEFQQCDEASKAVDPALIRKLANVNFTEQLKKYQDLEETGFRSDDDGSAITPPTEITAAPEQGTWTPATHFYVTRQYVAYQKEIVVLAPASAYTPGSKEEIEFRRAVGPATDQIQGMVQKNPQLKAAPTPWSRISDRPKFVRPAALQEAAQKSAARRDRVLAPRPLPRSGRALPRGQGGASPKKRKRGRFR